MERLYGIRNGNNQHKSLSRISEPSDQPQTQADLAKQLGISVDTLNNYKTLTQMIPELEELVDTGIVSKSAALAVLKELDTEEQEQRGDF